MNPSDRDSLCDMVLAAEAAMRFLGSQSLDEFMGDDKTQSAVLHQLLVLGEACKRLSPSLCQAHPQVPWGEIARTRDKLIHHYEEVDPRRLWQIVAHDLPLMLPVLQRLMPPDEQGIAHP